MRWKEESSRCSKHFPPWELPERIIYDAYKEGFINWNIFDKAIKKINTKKNGSWMFELKQEFPNE
jgi:hypothetical protein